MITMLIPIIPPFRVTYPCILPHIYRTLLEPISSLGISYTKVSTRSTRLRRMRTIICGLRHSGLRRLLKQESTSLVEFMKSRSLLKKKKRQHPTITEELKQETLLKNTGNLLTLQEWILASPNINGGNSRIYPTFEENNEGLTNKPGDSFSMDELLVMEVDEGDRGMEDSSSRSSLDGKTKKVRFRLPAMAGIFVLDSPGGYSAMCTRL